MSTARKLEGKLAVVTGAGTGIGRGIALEFGRQGAAVALHYYRDADAAAAAADTIVAAGGRARTLQGDLSNPVQCRRVVDEAAAWLGGLDVLVNNAGVTARGEFQDITPEFFDKVFGLNIRGYFFCAQAAIAHLLAGGGGNIVNITSIHAFASLPTYSVYASTKGAIAALTHQLAAEYNDRHIRVNAIAPGMVEVERHLRNPGYSPENAKRSRWGRVGTPQDAAALAAFLASDAADYVTGQVICMDGGVTARLSGGYIPLPERGCFIL